MTGGKMCVALCTCVVWTLCAIGRVTWYAVDPMAETPFMPDRAPQSGCEGAQVMMVAAKGEYEPCSFVLVADKDIGKVRLEVSELKNERGDVFPKEKLDLKTVKVWYQADNAWTSYFAASGLRLVPELLLNDEDLVKVDVERKANFARITEKDGRVHYQWLSAPESVDSRTEFMGGGVVGESFSCMKPNFCDAKTHQGATLRKGEYKQFFLTANVTKDTPAGLYRGEVKVKGEGEQWNVPLLLKVLDFELPKPKCYFDTAKDFDTFFCEYISIEMITMLNGGDIKLAEKQLGAICRDFVRHNETLPNYRDNVTRPDIGRGAGMTDPWKVWMGGEKPAGKAEMRYDARRQHEKLTKAFGDHRFLLSFGDEYGADILKGIRDMVAVYHDEGFRFAMNSSYGYSLGHYFVDLWWPPCDPDGRSADRACKFNQLGGDGQFGWYACHHVGVENPAFNRRQYGLGPYRAGLSCNFNYAHHLTGWNDRGTQYRAMMLVYGSGDGCIDTIQWEGFREGIDDIRYATLLKQLADPMAKSENTEQRYAAKKALYLLAEADGDDMDLTTLRLEMIRHIERLRGLEGKGGAK